MNYRGKYLLVKSHRDILLSTPVEKLGIISLSIALDKLVKKEDTKLEKMDG